MILTINPNLVKKNYYIINSIVVVIEFAIFLLVEHVVIEYVVGLRARLVLERVGVLKEDCEDPCEGVEVNVVEVNAVLNLAHVFLDLIGYTSLNIYLNIKISIN